MTDQEKIAANIHAAKIHTACRKLTALLNEAEKYGLEVRVISMMSDIGTVFASIEEKRPPARIFEDGFCPKTRPVDAWRATGCRKSNDKIFRGRRIIGGKK